ncbi:hypothetical protein GCM10009579_82440 [Streptomyces javensis]|uniref:Uncharacterized protein n=1 Tax=Streptomyces javensis TaxID=114698 RepID=A0ABN1XCP8_9ACTN
MGRGGEGTSPPQAPPGGTGSDPHPPNLAMRFSYLRNWIAAFRKILGSSDARTGVGARYLNRGRNTAHSRGVWGPPSYDEQKDSEVR